MKKDEFDPSAHGRETVPATSRSDAIAASLRKGLPQIMLFGESQAPGPMRTMEPPRPSLFATVIHGLRGTTPPNANATFGSFFSAAASKAWSSIRPPALPTVFFDTPGGEPPSASAPLPPHEVRSPRSTRRSARHVPRPLPTLAAQPSEVVPSRSHMGWYTSAVLAAVLAVVWIRSGDSDPKNAAAASSPEQQPTPAYVAPSDPAPLPALAPVQAAPESKTAGAAPAAPAAPAAAPPAAMAQGPVVAQPPTALASTAKPVTCEELTRGGRDAVLRGDLGAAQQDFTGALAMNPSYFPAAIGLADTLYAAGNKDQASVHYRDIIDHYPASMVPSRAKERSGIDTVATR